MLPFFTNAKPVDDVGDKHTYFCTSKKRIVGKLRKFMNLYTDDL